VLSVELVQVDRLQLADLLLDPAQVDRTELEDEQLANRRLTQFSDLDLQA